MRLQLMLVLPRVQEGGPGLCFWADFLDLQAEGPVPWRKEIVGRHSPMHDEHEEWHEHSADEAASQMMPQHGQSAYLCI